MKRQDKLQNRLESSRHDRGIAFERGFLSASSHWIVKIPNPKRYVWRPGGKTPTSLQKGATTRAASLAYGEIGMADGAPRLLTSNLDRLTRPKLQRWRIAAPQKFELCGKVFKGTGIVADGSEACN